MNILVTGGAGFIGSWVVDDYVKAGHRVTVTDNESSGKRSNVNAAALYLKVDVRDKASLEAVFKKGRFHVVNHHASQIDVRKSVQDPKADADVNIGGILHILDLAQRYRVKKILFSSSGGTIYGECRRPAVESNPEIPLSPYGVSKLASEKYIQTYAALHGLSFTILRYANVYGPRQDPHGEAGVVAIFSNKLLTDERPFIFGDGRQTRDYVYVGDVARANRLALRKATNEIINIGTGTETDVRRLYRIMKRSFGRGQSPVYKPRRPGELQRSVLSAKKAARVLGWRPAVSLQDGVRKTLDYFQDRFVKESVH